MRSQTAKLIFSAILAGAMTAPVAAQSLTVAYATQQTLAGAAANNINSATIDLSTGVYVIADYSATPSLHFFNLVDGTAATTPFINFTWDALSTPGALAGFGVGSNGGEIFLYDQSADPLGNIQKLDSTADTTAALVSSLATDPLSFSRNMTVEGTGTDTFIASVGTGPDATSGTDLFRSTDAGRTNFVRVGQIINVGAGRAGVGMSPVVSGQPPRYIVTSDFVQTLVFNLYELTGTFPTDPNMGYTLHTALPGVTGAQAMIDLGSATEEPAVIALAASSSAGVNSADVVMYQIGSSPNSLTEVARVGIPIGGSVTGSISNRGSLAIDRTNKAVYAAYRGAGVADAILSKINYVLTPIAPPPSAAETWYLWQ